MARKPIRIFVGTRRQKLKKLQNTFNMLAAMDAHEQMDALKNDRSPDLFFSTQVLLNAQQRLTDRINECFAVRR